MQQLQRIQSALHSLENNLLFILVMGMLGLSITQIFLRNFFEFGLVWAEAAIRLMVLWATMIGSMIAARSSQHLRIDLLERYSHTRYKKAITALMQLLTALLCLSLVYYSCLFIGYEYVDGTTAFANIPSWIFMSIIPVCFLVMGLRYLISGITHMTSSQNNNAEK
jgi:TRAP-type C4-dicarboxylate transport system permease small subunit